MPSIFSKLISGEIPCYKIAEDDKYFSFLDINPLSKGHALVIPKKETDWIFDIEDSELSGLIVFAKKIAKALNIAIDCKRVGLIVVGVEVSHAHIHLIPFNDASEMNFARPKLKFSQQEFTEILNSIQNNLG